MEVKFFKIALVFTIIVELISILISINNQILFDSYLHSFCIVSCTLLLYLLLRKNISLPWLFFMVVSITMSGLWFTNGGAQGGINYVYLIIINFMIFISTRKHFKYYIIIGLLNIFILYLIEYLRPDLITIPAMDPVHMFFFNLSNFLNLSICLLILIVLIKKAYLDERDLNIKQRIQLKEANEYRTNFFINIAHETKTPLTLIENYLNKYIDKYGNKEELLIVKNNFEKLKNDMSNFLDTEKLLMGKIVYDHNQIVDFSSSLREMEILYNEYGSSFNLHIQFNITDGVMIKADPLAISRITNNLLENAVKYSKDDGQVEVSLFQSEENIILSVKDQGEGLIDKQIEQIFDPYFQITHKKTNKQGIGMGLTIVNEIVKQLNGNIEVKSTPGQGSEFIVRLNRYIGNIEDRAVAFKPGIIKTVYTKKTTFIDREYDPELPTIMIVEDNSELLSYLGEELGEKYNIISALNGLQAIEKIESNTPPDLIISDIMMDKLDGFEFFKTLREKENLKAIPFIFITARKIENEKIKALSDGAIDFIYKPFNIKELNAKIHSIFETIKNQKKQALASVMKVVERESENVGFNRNHKMIKFHENCKKYQITDREKEVLALIEKGMKYKDIGKKLYIAERTVLRHVQNLFQKVNVKDKTLLLKKIFE